MNTSNSKPGKWAAENERNTIVLGWWTAAWVVTMAIATFGPEFAWKGNTALTLIAIFGNIAVGAGMIFANKRFLDGLDEMQRKIQLEAMALSLGVCLVLGLGWSNADIANLITFDAEISHLVILMGLTYGLGIYLGFRRYR